MPVDAIRSFFAGSRQKGDLIRILNAAPALLEAKTLFSLTDIIIVNETELAVFSEREIDENSSISEIISAARAILVRSDQKVVVTLGSKGCVAVTNDHASNVAGFTAKVVDTTGAGDFFCGVLAGALAEGDSFEDALLFANAAASLAVEKEGAGPSMPTRHEVIQRISTSAKTDFEGVS